MIAKLKNILRCYAVGMGIKETAQATVSSFPQHRTQVRPAVHIKRQDDGTVA